MSETTQLRFKISRPSPLVGYRVSIPNYEGGEVVTSDAYDALVDVLKELDEYYCASGPIWDRARAALTTAKQGTEK